MYHSVWAIVCFSIACAVFACSIAFTLHNVYEFLYKQQRAKDRGIFMVIFYAAALLNNSLMVALIIL